MWFLIVIAVLAIGVWLVNYSIHNSKRGRTVNKIPGPDLVILLGNAWEYILDPVTLFYKVQETARTYKSLFRLWGCGIPAVCMYDPADIEIILSSSKNISKSVIYRTLHPWLNTGLLTSTGEKWQKRRKVLTPTFHFNILRQYCRTFTEQSEKLVSKIHQETGRVTNLTPLITEFTLHTICETAMGTRLEDVADKSLVTKYKKAVHDMGVFVTYRLVRTWLFFDVIYRMTANYSKLKVAVSILHNFTTKVIREKRRITDVDALNNNEENVEEHYDGKRKLAMLDLLLKYESMGKIDEEGIREEVDTFMFEGHDTTAMGITFCLLLLANHKDIQDRIIAELDEIFHDHKQEASMDDYNNMRYLERCIKEALRLYPSVPFISREVSEDVQLTNYLIPKDTTIILFIMFMHRDPDLFPDPLVFDPDRFLPENCAKRHPFSYIPFSAGPRNCIGQKFALLEEKSVISAILRNFTLEPVTKPDDVRFHIDLVLRTKDPVNVRFVPRKREC